MEETKAKLKANSKDAHFADGLIDELSSIIGQLKHEPTIAHYPVSEVKATHDGKHYEMHLMTDGTIVYHAFGGITVAISPNMVFANATLLNFFPEYATATDGIADDTLAALNDMNGWILSLPAFVFSDHELYADICHALYAWDDRELEKLSNTSEPPLPTNEDYNFMEVSKTIEAEKHKNL